jgi:hypothetical protein
MKRGAARQHWRTWRKNVSSLYHNYALSGETGQDIAPVNDQNNSSLPKLSPPNDAFFRMQLVAID